jgi:2-polyprenyl-3-methyl-5-hydroxy-6-metoxy-1,4-benzoquinol methylase
MTQSKAWDWNKEDNKYWLEPCEESYYLAERWLKSDYRSILDLGCGLGRHSIYFAKHGFDVSALDLSEEAVNHLKDWAKKEALNINIKNADMLNLPYDDNSFDCVFSYHVISHTDTAGAKRIISEIERVLKPGGEVYLTLCSKETRSFKDAGYPKIDENSIVKTGEGPEKGIPHFYINLDEIIKLFINFNLLRIRHTDDCFFEGKKQNSIHYYIHAISTKH